MMISRRHLFTLLSMNTHCSMSTTPPQNLLTANLPIHQYLKEQLARNQINQLRQFQYQTLVEGNLGRSCFVNSCTGSGKTLAYILPILSQLLSQQTDRKGRHGAIILTLNKELGLQIYAMIRKLDPESKLAVKRAGPISHYLPVVAQLNKSQKQKQIDEDLINAKVSRNLVHAASWPKTDILISTPQAMYNLMAMSPRKEPIMPKYMAIDEADLLLQTDKNVSSYTNKVIEATSGKAQNVQFFISASSFPSKVQSHESLSARFPNLVSIEGEHRHKIPPNIELFFIEAYKTPHDKNHYLVDILKNKLKQSQKVIIFCNCRKSMEAVRNLLAESLGIDSLIYHASLDSNERSRVLYRFENSDLGSRGLDFPGAVSLVVEYEMAENVTGFINRVGRTGRNRLPGEVITMVDQKHSELFQHIQELVSAGDQLDEVFSRKRSYRKLYT